MVWFVQAKVTEAPSGPGIQVGHRARCDRVRVPPSPDRHHPDDEQADPDLGDQDGAAAR
jgi:hypothetical protein